MRKSLEAIKDVFDVAKVIQYLLAALAGAAMGGFAFGGDRQEQRDNMVNMQGRIAGVEEKLKQVDQLKEDVITIKTDVKWITRSMGKPE